MDPTQIILAIVGLLGAGGGGAGLLKAWQIWVDRKQPKTDNEYLREHYRCLIEDTRKEYADREARLVREHEQTLSKMLEQFLQLKTEYDNYVAQHETHKAQP